MAKASGPRAEPQKNTLEEVRSVGTDSRGAGPRDNDPSGPRRGGCVESAEPRGAIQGSRAEGADPIGPSGVGRTARFDSNGPSHVGQAKESQGERTELRGPIHTGSDQVVHRGRIGWSEWWADPSGPIQVGRAKESRGERAEQMGPIQGSRAEGVDVSGADPRRLNRWGRCEWAELMGPIQGGRSEGSMWWG